MGNAIEEKTRKYDLISPFHNPAEWIYENDSAFAVKDNYPVSPGHHLVVPKRPVTRIGDLTNAELVDCFSLVARIQLSLFREDQPTLNIGFNIGINEGKLAGQTISQLHIHVIPRYKNDVEDPVGGVRNVIPGAGNYRK